MSVPPRAGEDSAPVRDRWARGDREGAYALVVRETQDSLYRYLRYLLREEEGAREVFQDTYLRVFRALEGFRGEASLTTWVLTIGRNLALNRRRGERLRGNRQVPFEDAEAHPGPVSEADPAERRDLLAQVDALPEAQREAVLLYYGEDRTVGEIAAMTGRAANTVKSDLLRARTRLRAALGREPEPGPAGSQEGTRR